MSLGKILEKEVFKIVHCLADVDTAIVRTCNILCLLLQHTLNNNLPKSICDKDTKRQNVSHAYLKKSSKHLAKWTYSIFFLNTLLQEVIRLLWYLILVKYQFLSKIQPNTKLRELSDKLRIGDIDPLEIGHTTVKVFELLHN